MPHDAERLQQAYTALDRALASSPKLFAMVQRRILAEGLGFLDELALRALADEETGQTVRAQAEGQRLAHFHAEEAKHHHRGSRHA